MTTAPDQGSFLEPVVAVAGWDYNDSAISHSCPFCRAQDDKASDVDVSLERLQKFLRNSLEDIVESKRQYDFGPFRLDPAERRLLRDDQPVSLTPKCFDLLVMFVENSGHLLEKEVILERLWPDQFVEEANLSFNISCLRKALGEGLSGRRFIETVPKKGFRFLPRVEIHEAGRSGVSAESPEEMTGRAGADSTIPLPLKTAGGLPSSFKIVFGLISASVVVFLAYGLWASRTKPSVEESPRTIAVLPFKSLNGDSLEESLEMGMAEALITKLGKDGRTRAHLEPEEIELLRTTFRTSGWERYVRRRIDLLEKKSKKEYVPPTTLAGIHALAGEKERAFTWLEKAIETHDAWLSLIKIQPAYDSLRSDVRFATLLQRVNLTP